MPLYHTVTLTTISYLRVLSTFSQRPEKSTVLVSLESVSTLRIFTARCHFHCCLDIRCSLRGQADRCRQDVERKTTPQSGIQNIGTFRIVFAFKKEETLTQVE